LRENDGFTDKLHRKIVMKLLRNLRIAKHDANLDERKWMNPELLTIQVPQHMVARIQSKMNNLYDDPGLIREEKYKRSRSASREPNYGRNDRLDNTNSSKKFKTLKKKKPQQNEIDYAICEENVIYQMASDSAKKDRITRLEAKLDEYKIANDKLARENEYLKERLYQYEA
jgi:hypothetical protein